MKRDVERMGVTVGHGLEATLEQAVEPALARRLLALEEPRAQHRRQRQRYQRGDRDGDGDHDGKFAEQPADHAAHQQQWDKDGDQREADREDGEADFVGADDRGLKRRLAFFDMALDVLQHDDGIVDNEADGD